MKKFLLVLTAVITYFFCNAQVYNNEWIDYSKTYYKFSVGATGLYRITAPALSSAGLNNTPVQYFQLWHNGQEVPLYTTIAAGVPGPADFIEFFGEINDGSQDTKLYKFDSLQMNDKWSLYTDTSAYYLTVNTSGFNKRYTDPGNNIAANILPPETFFIHTLSKYYKEQQQVGFGVNLGEVIHSSTYETGEGWGSYSIDPGVLYASKNNNLFVSPAGQGAALNVRVTGTSAYARNVTVRMNGNTIASGNVSGYNIVNFKNNAIQLAALSGDTANFSFSHSGIPGDGMSVVSYQLSYPRKYNFGAAAQFYFELPAGSAKYIEVANFNAGVAAPVLLDINNNVRMTGVVAGGLVKFVIPASTATRKLFLFNTNASAVFSVSNFTPRNFTDYSLPANQGNYLIVSHSNLYSDANGINQVENYRQYRSSVAGGGYNAKIVQIDQLIDQFAFGIKHHPASVRNFAAYALANFTQQPKFLYLVGKGLAYTQFKKFEQDRNISRLALIPTFGFPASDNLLAAERRGQTTTIPVGRLSAITGDEVGIYLEKLKQFELAQTSTDQSINGKGWTKNIAQITGGEDDPGLSALINYYMDAYKKIAEDSLFGANVFSYNKNIGSNTAVGTNKTLDQLFAEGITMLTYFGHSSPNSIEFNLDNPVNYNNTGKYPLMMINGCNSGNLFTFDTLRYLSGGTLSEKFILAKQKGSIGYIATTHFGVPTQLDFLTTAFYKNFSAKMYGQSLGNLMKTSMEQVISGHGNDYLAQTHVEEINLHGDPAVTMNPHTKPDYIIQDSLISFTPAEISIAETQLKINAGIVNIGKVVLDTLTVRIQRKLPDNSIVLLGNYRLPAVAFRDSVVLTLNLTPYKDKGVNQLIVTLDPDNLIPELSEANNTVTKTFTIIEDEIRPVFPYEYAIVNNSNIVLYGSVANQLAAAKQYVMEMDTTALFNSVQKITRTAIAKGGVIKFIPGIALTDSTVYYWRVAPEPLNAGARWKVSSFVYIDGAEEGFSQSHYFQFKNNSYKSMTVDSSSRKFLYSNKTRKLKIRTGLFPYYNWDQINVYIDDNLVDYYGCIYNSLQFVVYDPVTLLPWKNYNSGGKGSYGSYPVCSPKAGGYRNFFEFPHYDSAYRRKAMQFFDSIPQGYYVSVSNLGVTTNNTFITKWKADTATLGSGKSLWHKFYQHGLRQIDSFTKNLPFLFVFKKGDTSSFAVKQTVGSNFNVQLNNSYDIAGKDATGSITSPWFGPVYFWNKFKWDENGGNVSPTKKYFEIIGKNNAGNEVVLAKVYNAKDTAIDFIDALIYPYLKVKMYNSDSVSTQATQLKYWMLTSDNIPEGTVSPNISFECPDSLTTQDTLHFKVSFLNVSNILFDSIKIRLSITDKDSVVHVYNNLANGARLNQLPGGDSVIISYDIPMTDYFGVNQLLLEVNPDNDQPEMFHYNNVLYKQLMVTNAPVCAGGSALFLAGSVAGGTTFQWQVNTGGGYSNIGDGAAYGGTSSSNLLLKNLATAMYGYKYKCSMMVNGVTTYTPEFILKFTTEWTGAVNSAWDNSANWSCNQLPDINTDVVLPSALSKYPIINNNVNAVCRSIKALPGSALRLNTGGKLDIKGPPGN